MNVDQVREKLHLCLLVACSYLHQVACSLLCLFHNQRTLVFLLYRPVSVSFQSELRHTLPNQILLHSLSLGFFYSTLRMEFSFPSTGSLFCKWLAVIIASPQNFLGNPESFSIHLVISTKERFFLSAHPFC